MIRVFPWILVAAIGLRSVEEPPVVRITYHVQDEAGVGVAAAGVQGWFGDVTQEGAHDRFSGLTGADGTYVARGILKSDVGIIVTADGFYRSRWVTMPSVSSPDQEPPYDLSATVTIKRIRSPRALFAKSLANDSFSPLEDIGRYSLGRTSTVDLVLGRLASPVDADGLNGDFVLLWDMTIESTDERSRPLDYKARAEWRSSRPGDGLLRGSPDGDLTGRQGSALVSAYEAPADGYTNTIVIHRRVRDGRVETNDDGHYLHYFRIRSQMNERGEVTNALYGKIYGPLNGNFRYYLNPTPNDRNVEFDPGRNLFEDLDPLERVTMP